MGLFNFRKTVDQKSIDTDQSVLNIRTPGFEYLKNNEIYFDSACQSLRPQPVIDSLIEYYQKHNSCGERVKYQWGRITDQKIEATREHLLKFLKLKKKDYFVSFTLNTTYGLNLLLSQFNPKKAGVKTIITSEIEHNSVFLSTLQFSTSTKTERIVLPREQDGSLSISEIPDNSLVVVNVMSNVDGRILQNLQEVIDYVHQKQGFIILDAAQIMAHHSYILEQTEADAICFSGHKIYSPSLGVMIVRKSLLDYLNVTFLGGGMVDDVDKNTYLPSFARQDKAYTIFEPGLQSWGEIIALNESISWLEQLPQSAKDRLTYCSEKIFQFLSTNPKIHCLNHQASTVLTFYLDQIDSHLLAEALSDQGIMVRSGYFCVHYYLDHKLKLPPLVRLSLGYQTTEGEIDRLISILKKF